MRSVNTALGEIANGDFETGTSVKSNKVEMGQINQIASLLDCQIIDQEMLIRFLASQG